MLLEKERRSVVEFGKKLITEKLVKGSGGNISLSGEDQQLIAISPSGLPYFETDPADVVVVDLDGQIVDGAMKPSIEIGFHLALHRQRSDIRAVVHTHSNYATTIACLGWELPAAHYLIAPAGEFVPCAPFATPGTIELSDHICNTIGGGNAVLMANHGLVAVGPTLPNAFAVAENVEFVARLFYQARCIGSPVILNSEQMSDVMRMIKTYGQSKSLK